MAHDRAFGFLEQFIEASSDNSWNTLIGGDPAWQHVLHALATCEFFLAPKEGKPELTPSFPQEVVMFGNRPAAPAKELVKAVAKEARAYDEKFLNGLNDEDLGKIHEGFSARMGMPVTNAALIANFIGHLYYHFGQCDAVLRNNGEPGLF